MLIDVAFRFLIFWLIDVAFRFLRSVNLTPSSTVL